MSWWIFGVASSVGAGRMGWFPWNGEEAPWSPYQRGVEVGYARQDFRGISLLPVAYKAMCSIAQNRLVHIVEERKLVAEEQGGFRKGRGCRDQLMTLVLLGQVKAVTKTGMFASFIDFKKAYDRVDRGKLWRCLEGMGL